MYLCLETIKVANKCFYNLEAHERRMNITRRLLYGARDTIVLEQVLNQEKNIPDVLSKCRILYDRTIHTIEFIPYKLPHISTLRCIEANELEYTYKYADRKLFDALKNQCAENEILIIKNGYVTDTSFSNIALYDGHQWITPSTPLLRGTKREQLLREKKIFEKLVPYEDLFKYKLVALINAMIDLEDQCWIPIEKVREL